MRGPLGNRVYRHLFAAQVIALAGTGLTTIALALLAYELAGGEAGRVLGIALALKMVAYVGIAPLVGAYAHRLPRRALLVGLDLVRAGMVALLLWVDAVWQIYLLIFLLNAGSAGFTPTFQATIPDVLRREADYTRALSLSRLAYDLENLLSPLLAALLLTLISFDRLFLITAVAFLVSAALVLSVVLPAGQEPLRGGWVRDNLAAGLRIYLGTPRLRGLLCLSFAVAAAGAMVIVNSVLYVRELLGRPEADLALAMAAFGGGSMVVALALPRLLDRVADRRAMLLGGGLMAIGLGLAALRPEFGAFLALWALLGAGASLVQTPAGRLLRRSCHPEDRPAVYAAQFSLSHACWLVTYPLAGWLGSAAGLAPTFLVLAVLGLGATAAAARLWPADLQDEREDGIDLLHTHEAMEHAHLHVHDEHHQHEHDGTEGPEPHRHPHRHRPVTHRHRFVIDYHHRAWP